MYTFIYDYRYYSKFSSTYGLINDKQKLLFRIIKDYHALEKGLTLPEPRLGFGRTRIFDIYNNCNIFLSKYEKRENQILQALSTILEYEKFHDERSYILDTEVKEIIKKVKILSDKFNIIASTQINISRKDYFFYTKSDFATFANSRKSVREYIKGRDIPDSLMKDIISLSLNAPSACNRQSARVHIYTRKSLINKIFALQNGNSGFGDLATAVIIVTSDIRAFYDPMERHQAYIDGGIYAMNLLYSLHYYEVAACMLNCSNTPKIDSELRKVCGIKDSEVFIAMISCGFASDDFSVALSKRLTFEDVCTIN